MSFSDLREVFLLGFGINCVVAIVWLGTLLARWDWPYAFSAEYFKVSRERVAEMNFMAFVLFKAANILFFLVPYIALTILKPV
jgi:hypothetical protein